MTSLSQIRSFALLSTFALTQSAWADGPAVPAGSMPAPGAPVAAAAAGPSSALGFGPMLVPYIAIFALLYFMVLRPQQKRAQEQKDLISALKEGDEVVTSSGFLGKVAGIADKVITLQLDDKVKVKLLKSQVAQVVKGPIKDLA